VTLNKQNSQRRLFVAPFSYLHRTILFSTENCMTVILENVTIDYQIQS
jgi:hypothetical protein